MVIYTVLIEMFFQYGGRDLIIVLTNRCWFI